MCRCVYVLVCAMNEYEDVYINMCEYAKGGEYPSICECHPSHPPLTAPTRTLASQAIAM